MKSPRASRSQLTSIQSSLHVIASDATLGKRMRAVQELGRVLNETADGDFGVQRVCSGFGAPSLLVALMLECGEEREATRNDIMHCLAALTSFTTAAELSDTRLWSLLMRMLYQ
eukprot:6178986-Pleurochrysis_carterae.AAC.2